MREQKQQGPLSSLFVPIFVGALCGWFLPYLVFKTPLLSDRFLDGAVGLVLGGIAGGVIGAMMKRR